MCFIMPPIRKKNNKKKKIVKGRLSVCWSKDV